VLFFLVLIGVGVLFSTASLKGAKPKDVDLSTLASQVAKGEIKSIAVSGSTLDAVRNDGGKEQATKESDGSLVSALRDYGVPPERLQSVQLTVKRPGGVGYWVATLVPIVIPFLLIAGFIYLMMRQVQGQNMRAMMFGQSSAREVPKDAKHRVTFKD